jgi:hypothetical protein
VSPYAFKREKGKISNKESKKEERKKEGIQQLKMEK